MNIGSRLRRCAAAVCLTAALSVPAAHAEQAIALATEINDGVPSIPALSVPAAPAATEAPTTLYAQELVVGAAVLAGAFAIGFIASGSLTGGIVTAGVVILGYSLLP